MSSFQRSASQNFSAAPSRDAEQEVACDAGVARTLSRYCKSGDREPKVSACEALLDPERLEQAEMIIDRVHEPNRNRHEHVVAEGADFSRCRGWSAVTRLPARRQEVRKAERSFA